MTTPTHPLSRAEAAVAAALALMAFGAVPGHAMGQPTRPVRELVQALLDPRPAVHLPACKALLAAGSDAVAPLGEVLNSGDDATQRRVFEIYSALANNGAPGYPWEAETGNILGRDIEVWRSGETKHVDVTEGDRRVHIKEDPDHIVVEATGPRCGESVTVRYAGATPFEMSQRSDQASGYDIYARWGGGIGTTWSVEGLTLEGNRFRHAGPVLRDLGQSRLETLRQWLPGQMAAAGLQGERRQRVQRALDALVTWGRQTRARRSETLDRMLVLADELRREVEAAGLPSLGDLLPAPEWARLGITMKSVGEAGVGVIDVTPGGRAAAMGLRPEDVILRINGTLITTTTITRVLMAEKRPWTLDILRDGRRMEVRGQ